MSEYALDQCLQGHTYLRGPWLCVTEFVSTGQAANTRQDYYSKWVWEIDLQTVLELSYTTLRVDGKMWTAFRDVTGTETLTSQFYVTPHFEKF